MKIMILSDIHGDADQLGKALEIYKREKFNRLFLLGDLMYHGPRNPLPGGYGPADVASLLNPLADSILAVRGNCDSEVDQMLLDFPILADFAESTKDGLTCHLSHGHLGTERIGRPRKGDIRLSGHTHIPLWQEEEGVFYGNPGSISLPKGGFPPSYGVLEGNSFAVVNLATGETINSGRA